MPCPHCAEFEPALQAWLKRKPKDVEYKMVPMVFRDTWKPDGQAVLHAGGDGPGGQVSHARSTKRSTRTSKELATRPSGEGLGQGQRASMPPSSIRSTTRSGSMPKCSVRWPWAARTAYNSRLRWRSTASTTRGPSMITVPGGGSRLRQLLQGGRSTDRDGAQEGSAQKDRVNRPFTVR